MAGRNGGNTIFTKMINALGAGTLLLTICAVPPANAATADHPDKAAAAALPPPGTYRIDPVHSFVYFGAWHHVVGLVRGRFDKVNGNITVSQDPAACNVEITIDTASINTQNSERDEDLRGPDFFDVKQFPAMTYRGRGIRRTSGNQWRMEGSLTIRGVAKVVPLTFMFKGPFPDTPPGKPMRVSFHGTAATRRGDFGMTRDNLMELGVPPAPGPDVEIEIDVEADATAPDH